MHSPTVFAGLALLSSAAAQAPYSLVWNYNSGNIYDAFEFVESPDTAFTGGFANYVGRDEAERLGMVSNKTGTFRFGPDTTNKYAATTSGRKSVRLQSWGYFDNGLLVGDFAHVPVSGCGMWPAFWVYQGEKSETYSEIDILENVNRETTNTHSFYTSEQCTVNRVLPTSGEFNTDCHHVSGNDEDGCRGAMAEPGTFNQGFNDNYKVIAMQVEFDGIKIWHFKKNEVPADLNTASPKPQNWSKKPSVHLTPKNCDFNKAWRMFHIVLNITFCGGWAGNAPGMWNNAGTGDKSCQAATGQSSCINWVGQNPADFKNTYFDINSIKLFQRP